MSTLADDEGLEKLKADIASLARVQSRLKNVSDAKRLPSILSALLPRLLTRLEEYSIQHVGDRDSESVRLESQAFESVSGILVEGIQRLKNHAEVEVRDVIVSTLSFIRSKSPLASTFSLSILAVGMSRDYPSDSIPSQTMALLICNVDELHYEAMNLLSPAYPNRFFTASWMLLDCLALSATVKPIVAWDSEDHDWHIRYERHISHCSIARDHKDAIDATNSHGNGLFHLILDLLLLPLSSPMQTRLYMSQIGCLRMEHRHRSIRCRSSETWYQEAKRPKWSDAAVTYLSHLKMIVLRCASWPLDEGLFQGANRECVVVLNVLVASKATMHGKLAMDFLDKFGGTYSLDTMLALLVLLVGDENTLQLKGEVGDSSPASWERILGQTPQNAFMYRPPLPMHIAEGVMHFLSENKLQKGDISADRKGDIMMAMEMCLVWTSAGDQELAISLSPAQKKQKWFYSMLVVKSIYQNVATAGLIDKDNPDAWATNLIGKCLKMCIGVLSLVLEAGQSNVEKLRNNTKPVAGAPRPFGRRADLNTLLNDHREGQKLRQLSSDDALVARKAAYELISLLSAHTVQCSTNFFQLPSLLLGCAIHEEDIMQQSVTDSLCHLLSAYVKALSSDWRQLLGARTIKDSKQLATPLLPVLLDAICADSLNARRNAKEWNEIILPVLDSEAASFLSLCLTCIENGVRAPSVAEVLFQVRGMISSLDMAFINLEDTEGMKRIQSVIHADILELVAEWKIPYDTAQCILCDHSFSLAEAKESCRSDLKTLLEPFKTTAAHEKALNTSDNSIICGICYDEVPSHDRYSLKCGHIFCISCWRSFIDETRDQNPSALLRLTCPQHQCDARITLRHLEAFGESSYQTTFETFLMRTFVQAMRAYRFCPGVDCQCVLQRNAEANRLRNNVVCQVCSTASCFECGEMPHLPATCKHVTEWQKLVGNSTFWIRNNAKSCPGCDTPIEKNGGCNHMTCKHCDTQFCWLCLTKLSFHSEAHSCNQYTETGEAESSDDVERGLFLAKRYEAHESALLFTRDEIQSLESRPLNHIEEDYYDIMMSALEVVMEARIFLKNSYMATFGLRNHPTKLAEFESHQGALEVLTEKLNQLTDMNVQRIYRERGKQSLTMHFQRLSFHQFSVCTYMTRILELDLDGLTPS